MESERTPPDYGGHPQNLTIAHDLAFAAGSIRIAIGQGDGTFVEGQSIVLDNDMNDLIATDLDHDGNIDLNSLARFCAML